MFAAGLAAAQVTPDPDVEEPLSQEVAAMGKADRIRQTTDTRAEASQPREIDSSTDRLKPMSWQQMGSDSSQTEEASQSPSSGLPEPSSRKLGSNSYVDKDAAMPQQPAEPPLPESPYPGAAAPLGAQYVVDGFAVTQDTSSAGGQTQIDQQNQGQAELSQVQSLDFARAYLPGQSLSLHSVHSVYIQNCAYLVQIYKLQTKQPFSRAPCAWSLASNSCILRAELCSRK